MSESRRGEAGRGEASRGEARRRRAVSVQVIDPPPAHRCRVDDGVEPFRKAERAARPVVHEHGVHAPARVAARENDGRRGEALPTAHVEHSCGKPADAHVVVCRDGNGQRHVDGRARGNKGGTDDGQQRHADQALSLL